jgi:phosphatidate phosphatase PAH1
VISDVDGTVTKSDLLGHVLPRLGTSDWAHDGIANLYTDIFKNGYKILYLSSRPIGYSNATKKYLKNIKQSKKHEMPDGPLLLSPDRLAKSFYREVIIKKPHIFKISCLQNILNLFPPNSEPFYAGFGNRDTDAISYRAVAVNLGKIYIINPKGEIKQFN